MVEVSFPPEKLKQKNFKTVFVESDPLMQNSIKEITNSVGGMEAVFLSGLSEKEVLDNLRKNRTEGNPADILFVHLGIYAGKKINGLEILLRGKKLAKHLIVVADVSRVSKEQRNRLPTQEEFQEMGVDQVIWNISAESIRGSLIQAKEAILNPKPPVSS